MIDLSTFEKLLDWYYEHSKKPDKVMLFQLEALEDGRLK